MVKFVSHQHTVSNCHMCTGLYFVRMTSYSFHYKQLKCIRFLQKSQDNLNVEKAFEEDVPMIVSVNVCVYVKYDALWKPLQICACSHTLPQTNAETIVNTKATLFSYLLACHLEFLGLN